MEATKLLGDCQNYGPFLGPYYNTGPNTGPSLGNPKRDHNFDNPPIRVSGLELDLRATYGALLGEFIVSLLRYTLCHVARWLRVYGLLTIPRSIYLLPPQGSPLKRRIYG